MVEYADHLLPNELMGGVFINLQCVLQDLLKTLKDDPIILTILEVFLVLDVPPQDPIEKSRTNAFTYFILFLVVNHKRLLEHFHQFHKVGIGQFPTRFLIRLSFLLD
jgi:hypothetical protein